MALHTLLARHSLETCHHASVAVQVQAPVSHEAPCSDSSETMGSNNRAAQAWDRMDVHIFMEHVREWQALNRHVSTLADDSLYHTQHRLMRRKGQEIHFILMDMVTELLPLCTNQATTSENTTTEVDATDSMLSSETRRTIHWMPEGWRSGGDYNRYYAHRVLEVWRRVSLEREFQEEPFDVVMAFFCADVISEVEVFPGDLRVEVVFQLSQICGDMARILSDELVFGDRLRSMACRIQMLDAIDDDDEMREVVECISDEWNLQIAEEVRNSRARTNDFFYFIVHTKMPGTRENTESELRDIAFTILDEIPTQDT